VLRRGVERGEIDPERLTPRIATVALDLLRHEILMTLQPVSEEAIAEIVDDFFCRWYAQPAKRVRELCPEPVEGHWYRMSLLAAA
jgi:hypothetical protein